MLRLHRACSSRYFRKLVTEALRALQALELVRIQQPQGGGSAEVAARTKHMTQEQTRELELLNTT